MKDEKYFVGLSKFLSLVLRHQPQTIKIELDSQGWTEVSSLLIQMKKFGKQIDFDTLKTVVETNNKKRFEFNQEQTKIRASQGHSVEVDLGYTSQIPPEYLYHGTATKFIESILKLGLQKINRHHVHLSSDIETAIQVGARHGKPVVLKIMSELMYEDGFQFYISTNGVWLTDEVPVKYIKLNKL